MSIAIHSAIPSFEAVEAAIQEVHADDEPDWGKMTAPQMLEHLARFNEIYLGRIKVPFLMRILARTLGRLFLRQFLARSPYRTRKGIRTLPVLRVTGPGMAALDVDAVRARLLSTMGEIHQVEGTWKHPLYGQLDAKVVQALVRHHAAHHLRQFGKL